MHFPLRNDWFTTVWTRCPFFGDDLEVYLYLTSVNTLGLKGVLDKFMMMSEEEGKVSNIFPPMDRFEGEFVSSFAT